MKKFSTIAALAAMIALGAAAHAEIEGQDAGGYFPGGAPVGRGPLPPPPIPYPHRLERAYIRSCAITNIGKFNAIVYFLGTNPADSEPARIGPVPGGLDVYALKAGLIQGGNCGTVVIDWAGTFELENFGRPVTGPASAPVFGGPAAVVPGDLPPGY